MIPDTDFGPRVATGACRNPVILGNASAVGWQPLVLKPVDLWPPGIQRLCARRRLRQALWKGSMKASVRKFQKPRPRSATRGNERRLATEHPRRRILSLAAGV